MLIFDLIPNQENTVQFVLVNNSGAEVSGLGGTFSPVICFGTNSAVAATGAKGELSNGGYYYTFTASECDSDNWGAALLIIPAIGLAVQQNVPCVIGDLRLGLREFTYTTLNNDTGLPEEGVTVWITADAAGTKRIWAGYSDALGVARDVNGGLPRLTPGTYYVWRYKAGFTDSDPDIEVIT